MQAGHVLYMPEWWPHEAKATATHSLHVTLRMFPLRWMDLMREVCTGHPALADALPRERLDEGTLLDQMLGILDSPAFRQALPSLLEASMRKYTVPKSVLPDDGFRQLLELDHIELGTRLVRSAGAACQVFEKDNQVCIGFPGGVTCGPVSVKQVFEFIAQTTELRAQDLPPLEDIEYDRLVIVRTLVRDGLLRIARTS